jgi:hypothetical protein
MILDHSVYLGLSQALTYGVILKGVLLPFCEEQKAHTTKKNTGKFCIQVSRTLFKGKVQN